MINSCALNSPAVCVDSAVGGQGKCSHIRGTPLCNLSHDVDSYYMAHEKFDIKRLVK
jgi:hypothetical protein